MAEQFLWIAEHRGEARDQALRGRAMVEREWTREKAFRDLARVFDEVAPPAGRSVASTRPGQEIPSVTVNG
jgi:hypothetical protein